MTPQARAQAAIEILDAVIAAARDAGPAADTLVQRYFKARRYAGAKDRRAVRDLVYAAIRRAGERPESGRAALAGLAEDDPAVAALFDGAPHGPAPLSPGEPRAPAGVAPKWLAARLAATLGAGDLAALLERAPLDLRVNTLKATRSQMRAAFPDAFDTPHAPDGLRFPEPFAVEASAPFLAGQVEVQDEGSQLLSLACGAAPGMTVVDLCAGAGGKTLALAAMMAGKGRIIACDADRARLARLAPRAERAGVSIIETRLLDGGREAEALADLAGAADIVLVDAPCSGTGTWRRNPEARWRLTAERLTRLTTLQARLLAVAARLVRPGGALVYGVCSLLPEEGPAIAAGLDWPADEVEIGAGTPAPPGIRLTPSRDGTDGFFFARMRRPC
ncbi:RsmB/NOP family class I SAM-dependent RNA methyltransferase [Sphingomonas quercus]|uniref:RsmB/NOP family class I SAM-dependent RNA methyltransferase n=1 Tax=Sphingomonas quercus TaxID=2842451 RepID=A0ABS6BFH2_9SPHN|nr:RsmB/NOP family class I SAM-dependent RNA methyltransferase [Sphingomonas quercus]MBU3076586.1 RsmB/NOP family class I SAM-dependent RNA methyltransferase [Sphingomonas quercus]